MPKRVEVVEKILGANELLAEENRGQFDQAGLFAVNLMASPGAGKTSLIERTLEGLGDAMEIAVIDGDIATSIDADRAAKAGATAIQINTGGECHLDAVMLKTAMAELDLSALDLLIVENVGNLVCPASFPGMLTRW
jgi:hydrogenase nickel incorporation protein HypB